MRRQLLLAIFMALIVALAVQVGCGSREASSTANVTTQQTGISVTGEGKVSVDPDLAIVRLGVEAKASTVMEARDDAAEAMGDIMAALTDKGIEEKDIQTQRFTIYPYTERKTNDIVEKGFRVTNVVVAKIREVDNVAEIVDAVAIAGGDLTRVESLTFTVDDPSPFEEQAREEAMADAKAKAEQLAKLGDVKLGKPTFISEGGGFIPMPYPYEVMGMGMAEEAGVPTPISAGEIEVQLNVQVIYAIE